MILKPNSPEAIALNTDYLYISVILALVLAGFFYLIVPQVLRIDGRSQRILYLVTFLVWIVSIDIDHLVSLSSLAKCHRTLHSSYGW